MSKRKHYRIEDSISEPSDADTSHKRALLDASEFSWEAPIASNASMQHTDITQTMAILDVSTALALEAPIASGSSTQQKDDITQATAVLDVSTALALEAPIASGSSTQQDHIAQPTAVLEASTGLTLEAPIALDSEDHIAQPTAVLEASTTLTLETPIVLDSEDHIAQPTAVLEASTTLTLETPIALDSATTDTELPTIDTHTPTRFPNIPLRMQRAMERLERETEERWRPISTAAFINHVTYNDYLISETGSVYKSTLRRGHKLNNCIINSFSKPDGTREISLVRDYNRHLTTEQCKSRPSLNIDFLVMYSFMDNPPCVRYKIRHINGDKSNNAFNNLAFVDAGDYEWAQLDPIWHRAIHPEIPGDRQYYITRQSQMCKVTQGGLRLHVPHFYENSDRPKFTFSIEQRAHTIMIYKIMASTFFDDFDPQNHYVYHKDMDINNVDISNLLHLKTVEQLQQTYMQHLRNHKDYPNRVFKPVKYVHPTQTFSMYIVSNRGELFSMYQMEELSLSKNINGYHYTKLIPDTPNPDGRATYLKFNRLMWSSFNEEYLEDNIYVDHWNNIKTDDDISNLQAVTVAENNRRGKQEPQQIAQREFEILNGLRMKIRLPPPPTKDTTWRVCPLIHWPKLVHFGPLDHVLVSDMGHVKRRDNDCPFAIHLSGGYQKIRIPLKDKHKRHYLRSQKREYPHNHVYVPVHVLVAHVFCSGYGVDGADTVDHRDEDKQNNAARNLKFVTMSENTSNALGYRMLVIIKRDPPERSLFKKFKSLTHLNRRIKFPNLKKLRSTTFKKKPEIELKGTIDGKEEVFIIRSKKIYEKQEQSQTVNEPVAWDIETTNESYVDYDKNNGDKHESDDDNDECDEEEYDESDDDQEEEASE